ncbi:MAG: hypothetical protein QXP17_02955, partial [Candidatus Jordarchaeales archaeon]
LGTSPLLSPDDPERAALFRAQAVDLEVGVIGEGVVDPQALKDGEVHGIHEGKALVGVLL